MISRHVSFTRGEMPGFFAGACREFEGNFGRKAAITEISFTVQYEDPAEEAQLRLPVACQTDCCLPHHRR